MNADGARDLGEFELDPPRDPFQPIPPDHPAAIEAEARRKALGIATREDLVDEALTPGHVRLIAREMKDGFERLNNTIKDIAREFSHRFEHDGARMDRIERLATADRDRIAAIEKRLDTPRKAARAKAKAKSKRVARGGRS